MSSGVQTISNLAQTPQIQEHAVKSAHPKGRIAGQDVHREKQQSQIVQRKYLKAATAAKTSLTRMINAQKRMGQAEHPDATGRAAERYDEFLGKLPNLPGKDKLRALLTNLFALNERMKVEAKEKRRASVDGEDLDEEEDEGSKTAEGSRRRESAGAILGELRGFGGDSSGHSGGGSSSGDPSHEFAALEMVREAVEGAEKEGAAFDPDFLAGLEDVKRHFEQPEIVREVRAGFAAAPIAAEKAATLGTDPAAVRNAYRQMIRQEPSAAKIYDNFVVFFPGLVQAGSAERFEEVFETFTRIAGSDLGSLTGPSTSPELLGALLLELRKIKQIRTIFDGCADLAANVTAVDKNSLLDPTRVGSVVLHYIENPSPTPKEVINLLAAAAA